MSEQANASAATTEPAAKPLAVPGTPARISITGKKKLLNRPSFKERQEKAAKAAGVEFDATDNPEKPDVTESDPAKPAESTASAAPDTRSDAEKLAAIKEFLEKGDLSAAAELTKADKKAVDTSNEKYAVLRRKQEKIDKGVQHLASEETRLTKLGEELRTEFGTPREFKRLYKQGKFSTAATMLQKWLGEDFGTITRNIAREVAGLDPKEKALLEAQQKLEQDRAELEAQRTKTQTTQTQSQKRENALKTVATKCAGHQVLKIKNGADLVLAEMEAAWDPDQQGCRITFKQAADAVLERKLEDARALGLDKPAAAPKTSVRESRVVDEVVIPVATKTGRFTQRKSFEERNEAARLLTLRSRPK